MYRHGQLLWCSLFSSASWLKTRASLAISVASQWGIFVSAYLLLLRALLTIWSRPWILEIPRPAREDFTMGWREDEPPWAAATLCFCWSEDIWEIRRPSGLHAWPRVRNSNELSREHAAIRSLGTVSLVFQRVNRLYDMIVWGVFNWGRGHGW